MYRELAPLLPARQHRLRRLQHAGAGSRDLLSTVATAATVPVESRRERHRRPRLLRARRVCSRRTGQNVPPDRRPRLLPRHEPTTRGARVSAPRRRSWSPTTAGGRSSTSCRSPKHAAGFEELFADADRARLRRKVAALYGLRVHPHRLLCGARGRDRRAGRRRSSARPAAQRPSSTARSSTGASASVRAAVDRAALELEPHGALRGARCCRPRPGPSRRIARAGVSRDAVRGVRHVWCWRPSAATDRTRRLRRRSRRWSEAGAARWNAGDLHPPTRGHSDRLAGGHPEPDVAVADRVPAEPQPYGRARDVLGRTCSRKGNPTTLRRCRGRRPGSRHRSRRRPRRPPAGR